MPNLSTPKPVFVRLMMSATGTIATLGVLMAAINSPAKAQVAVHHGHYDGRYVDRSRPGWWHGHSAFVSYAGPRHGYYFAPGYGYYPVPRGYSRTVWLVGVTLPPTMRRYVVVAPAGYGLALPPAGYGWYYAGTSFVLASVTTGMIVQSVAGGW